MTHSERYGETAKRRKIKILPEWNKKRGNQGEEKEIPPKEAELPMEQVVRLTTGDRLGSLARLVRQHSTLPPLARPTDRAKYATACVISQQGLHKVANIPPNTKSNVGYCALSGLCSSRGGSRGVKAHNALCL